jgi:hypothetical protein
MKKSSIVACALGAALICAVPVSVQWSPEKTLRLSRFSADCQITLSSFAYGLCDQLAITFTRTNGEC